MIYIYIYIDLNCVWTADIQHGIDKKYQQLYIVLHSPVKKIREEEKKKGNKSKLMKKIYVLWKIAIFLYLITLCLINNHHSLSSY